jgi:MFS family permease
VVFFASVEPVEVVYAKSTLNAGDLGLGVLLGIWGAGAAIGSLLFARAGSRPLGSMLSAGTLCVGLAYLGWAAAPNLAIACVAALIGGVGNGIQWPSLVSAVQRLTPPEMQGRLMSAIGSMTALCPAIGFALGGVLAAATSTRIAMLCAGAVATLATAAFLRLWLWGPLREVGQAQERPSEALTL